MPEYKVVVFTTLEAETPEGAAELFLELLSDRSWATHVDATDVSTGETVTVEFGGLAAWRNTEYVSRDDLYTPRTDEAL